MSVPQSPYTLVVCEKPDAARRMAHALRTSSIHQYRTLLLSSLSFQMKAANTVDSLGEQIEVFPILHLCTSITQFTRNNSTSRSDFHLCMKILYWRFH